MKTDSTYPIDLITSYFAGEATSDDRVFLAAWLKADLAHKEFFNSCRNTWASLERSKIESQVDVDQEWNTLKKKVDLSPVIELKPAFGSSWNKEDRRFFSPRSLRYAALLIILIIPAFFIFRILVGPHTKRMSADVALLESKLPDGTSVTLNTGSTIEYPDSFKNHERDVNLRGEAYFEVTHDKSRPFIISAGKVRIQVLGTSFYVNTNALNGKMEVVLTNGKVAIYYDDDLSRQVILAPGEKADISVDQEGIIKTTNDDPNYISWKTHRLVFTNDHLGEIVKTLGKVYHAQIRITNPAVSQCRLTATFDDQTLGSVLNVIGTTLNLKITQKGSLTEISGNACH